MEDFGLSVKGGAGGKRIELRCEHQSGALYATRGEASWVCSDDMLAALALAGFFGELTDLDDDRVHEIMQRWGIYFRRRPLDGGPEGGGGP